MLLSYVERIIFSVHRIYYLENKQHVYFAVNEMGRRDGNTICRGVVANSKNVRTGFAALLVPPDRLVDIDVTEITQDLFAFLIRNPVDAAVIAPSEQYLFISGWDTRGAEAVVDRTWQKAVFEPKDAIQVRSSGYRARTRLGRNPQNRGAPGYAQLAEMIARIWGRIRRRNTPQPKETRIVPGGWDHEHCEICNECICLIHGPDGYANKDDNWVCPACYEKYVEPMSFDFLLRD